MELPCETCVNKTERVDGHRIFIGCKDDKLKEDNFITDDYFYCHKCKAYKKEDAPQSTAEAVENIA